MSWKGWFLLGLVAFCAIFGLNYGLFHWWGAAPSGFVSWGVDSVNGMRIGSDQFTQSGMFTFPYGGVDYHGRIVCGNLFYDGDKDLGFAITPWVENVSGTLVQHNTSVALRELDYHASILVYLLQAPTDMLPGLTAVQNGILGTQYSYREYDILHNHVAAGDVDAYLRANYLSVPSNYLTTLSQYLNLDIGVFINLDTSLLGITSFSNTTSDQYFNLTSVWAGVLSANAKTDYEGGLISAPGTNITGSGFSQTPDDRSPTTATGYSAQSVGTAGEITDWINAHDPTGYGHHFDVSSADSVMYTAGAAELGMAAGDPVTLTEGDWNSNATINQTQSVNTTLGDPFRGYVKGYIPITLRPETTITQTTYTYNQFSLLHGFWSGLTGTALLGQTVAKPTAVTVKNPYVIQSLDFRILCAANYTVYPLTAGNQTDVKVPSVNGTNSVFNTALTGVVSDVTGNTALDINDVLDWLGGIGGWIIAIVVIFVIALLVWRYARPRKGHR